MYIYKIFKLEKVNQEYGAPTKDVDSLLFLSQIYNFSSPTLY